MGDRGLNTRRVLITLLFCILTMINKSQASEDDYDNADEVNDDMEEYSLPWLGVIIFILIPLCMCGCCIGIICFCYKKCKKTSATLNKEGDPFKETEMTSQGPSNPANYNLNPPPPEGSQYTPIPNDPRMMPVEPGIQPGYQKQTEAYGNQQGFTGYPQAQQSYYPAILPAQPGFNQAQSGFIPAQQGFNLGQQSFYPALPQQPAQPGYAHS